jgi:hypothetical protein
MSAYHDKTARAYARIAHVSEGRARAVVTQWYRYVNKRSARGKSPQSTAKHIARFTKDKSVCACGSGRAARDCACLMFSSKTKTSRDASPKYKAHRKVRKTRTMTHRGVVKTRMRVSAKGIPYNVCPRGMRLQALLFPKPKYSAQRARAWAKSHGHRVLQVEDMPNNVRVRVLPSSSFVKGSFRVIQLKGYERHAIRGYVACPRFAIARKVPRLTVKTAHKPTRRLKHAA